MNCKKCSNELIGKQKSYCSKRCSKLHLKALYKIRNKEKILAYNRAYRKGGMRPMNKGRKIKVIKFFGSVCNKCGTEKELNVHHLKPLRAGGNHNYNNLMVLCFKCHMDWEQRMKNFWIFKEKEIK